MEEESKRLNFSISIELFNKLREKSYKEKTTMSEIFRNAISKEVEEKKVKSK
jgi:metal-responsive CopG/Arc/MetJ family transcriptional regulator